MNDVGGISVVGLTTGGHFIPDIRVNVPHKCQVWIPIEQYLKSKDLHRAINSGVIFKLDSVMGQQQEVVPSVDLAKMAQLELDNQRLKEALELAHSQNLDLQLGMKSLQEQMGTVLSALGRIEAAPQIATIAPGVTLTSINEAVGGEAPMFLPDVSQELGSARINIESSVSGDSVTGAASKLRALRKGSGK